MVRSKDPNTGSGMTALTGQEPTVRLACTALMEMFSSAVELSPTETARFNTWHVDTSRAVTGW
jgi:hypothetical protein